MSSANGSGDANSGIPRSVEIPLKGSDAEVIEIAFDELPQADEVLAILQVEEAALHIWVTLACEYYRQGREEEFVKILECSRTHANIDYNKSEEDQVRLSI